MEVNLADKDVITMVLEYLHSRQLYDSAVALETETGVMMATDDSMPEHTKFLRNLCLNGEWENVLFYLEPFTEMDEASTKRLHFLILRQKYVEVVHSMSKNKSCSTENKEALMKLMSDIRPLGSEDELLRLRSLTTGITNNYNSIHSISAARFNCFQDILEVLGPFFGCYEPCMPGECGDQNEKSVKFTRLESIITDALVLDECCKCCYERSFKISDDHCRSHPLTLSTSRLESRGTDPTTNAAVLFWIYSLRQSDIYKQPYQIEDVLVKTHSITEADTYKSFASVSSPGLISASMNTPNSAQQRIPHPLTTKSLQVSNSQKLRSSRAKLSESGPMRFSDFRANNEANTNNNSNVVPQDVSDNTPTENSNVTTTQQRDNDLVVEDSPIVQVNGWTDANLEQHDKSFSENPVDGTSKSEVKEFFVTDSARTDPEAADRVSSNAVPDLHETATATSKSPSASVSSSHEQFLSERRLLKRQKEEFLRDLEEKEKRNADIRRQLLETVPVPSQAVMEESGSTSIDSGESSSIQSNYSPRSPRPFRKLQCTQLDYLEDTHAIRTMAFHPSGQVYAVGSNSKALRICSVPREITSHIGGNGRDIDGGDNIRKMSPKVANVITKRTNYHKGSVYCSAWNDDGSLLATGSNDKLVKLIGFDILGKNLDENSRDLIMHRGIVREVSFLYESNNTLASAGVDQMVHISDCMNECSIHSLAGHNGQILGLYSWRHEMLASSSEDKTTRLWDVRAPRCVSIIGVGDSNPSIATSICVDNPGNNLAMGMDCAKIGIYDLRGGKFRVQYKCHGDEIRSVRYNPVFENLLLSSSYDGSIVITDVDGLLSEIDPTSSHLHHWKRLTESSNKLIQCRWHPNGDAFASTSVDKTCKVYLKIYS